MPVPARQPRTVCRPGFRHCRRPAATGPGPAARPAPPPAPPRHPRPGLHTAQRCAQRRELVTDQPALLGIHPPGQLVGAGEPVGVLGRQLGLAHPAHPLERLHHRRVPGQQPLPDRHQQPAPAGEPWITGREIPHPRHAARQPRTRALQLPRTAWRAPAREHRLPVRPPRPGHCLQQHPPRPVRIQPGQVAENQRPQHRGHLRQRAWSPPAPAADGPALSPARAPAPPSTPRWCTGAVRSTPADSSATTRSQRASASLIASTKFPPGRPVPHIQLNGVPGIGQLPGHPFGPRPVRTGMANKEIGPFPAHTGQYPPAPRTRRPDRESP